MARTRTFLAVELGDAVRAAAARLQTALAQTGVAVKWVEPANLHVTLLFLGEVDDRELHGVCRAVAAVAAGEPPIPLRVSGVGAFPNARRPRTVWGGITDGAADLLHLFTRLEAQLIDMGAYRREARPYTPHLTLGRVTSDADGQALAAVLPKHLAWDGGRTTVSEVVVFASELRRGGPEYSVLGRGPLLGKPGGGNLAPPRES